MDKRTFKDIAYNIAVRELAQPWTNLTYHGHKGLDIYAMTLASLIQVKVLICTVYQITV